jgi:hypothetical protein
MSKPGRNAQCPCGSGKKYKKCHGRHFAGSQTKARSIPSDLKKFAERMYAKELQKLEQQGLGRPIVSTTLNDQRIVIVGDKVMHSNSWSTFHDFLFDYIKKTLGADWGNNELAKPFTLRHPILQWYEALCSVQKSPDFEAGPVKFAPITGAVAAYLGLAYNLYLLAHNAELQNRLVRRLKNPDQFHGAFYETFVAAAFIRAGFSIELENETDGNSTHCEFTATHPSGRKYSVEAKARHVVGVLGASESHGTRSDRKLRVGNQLYAALKKRANERRVVFIDVNVPDHVTGVEEVAWLTEALDSIRSKEISMKIDKADAPSAYVFLTNLPYHHAPDSRDFRVAVLAEGFKIPDFKMGAQFASLRDARISRDRHKDMFDLAHGFFNQKVPSTFDGEIPEFAFENAEVTRLIIGQHYVVPCADGVERTGELQDAIVMEQQKMVYGVYVLEDGKAVIASCPISEKELEIYRDHPKTFFGVAKEGGDEIKSALDLYDKMFEVYRHSEKSRLLGWMAEFIDIAPYKDLSQQEIAEIYCEKHAELLFSQHFRGKER